MWKEICCECWQQIRNRFLNLFLQMYSFVFKFFLHRMCVADLIGKWYLNLSGSLNKYDKNGIHIQCLLTKFAQTGTTYFHSCTWLAILFFLSSSGSFSMKSCWHSGIISQFSPVTIIHRQFSMSANQITDSPWFRVSAACLWSWC